MPIQNPGGGGGSGSGTVTGVLATSPLQSDGNSVTPTISLVGSTGSGTSVVLGTSPTLTTPIIGSYTFATLPSAAANSGAMARVTDIGPATAGSLWLSNGTIWKPVGGRVTLATLASRFPATHALGESSPAFQFLMPSAFLGVLDRLRLSATLSKAGTTTTGTLTVYIGPLGTNVDPAITGTGGAMLSAANRSIGFIDDFVVRTTTSITKQGSGTSAVGSYAAAVATAFSAATAISNVSGGLYFTVTITPGATDDIALEDALLEYICV